MITLYTPWLPLKLRGLALRWAVLIHRDSRYDQSLHNHEKIHIEQMKEIGTLVYAYKYFTSQEFRAGVEAEAFLFGSGYTKAKTHKILTEFYRVDDMVARQALSFYNI